MKTKLLLLSSLLLIGTGLSNVNAVNLDSYKNLIPAYWWSYDLNNKLTKLDPNSSIVIVNPSNGDFNNTEDVFVDEINKTHQKNNLAIGYIYTKYGNRNLDEVKKRVDDWLKYYPNIDGIFLDEVSDEGSKLDYYTKIYNYIKSKNSNLIVVLNPGTTPNEGYFNIADKIVVFENPCSDYNNYTMPEWEKNYEDKISFLGYSCSQEQYNKLENKYGQYATYFTDDGTDGNPWDSFSKYLLKGSNNSDNTTTNNAEKKYAPYSFEKFHNILDVSKLTYPDGHTLVRKDGDYEGYKSDFFYATKDGNMVFVLEKHEGKYQPRVELRQRINGKDTGWDLSENVIHILKEKVKLQRLSGTDGMEYTFSQIHSEEHPLLRMAVVKDKDGKKDHIWAIVRITTKDSGRRTQRYDLGEVNPNNFDSFTIKVGNNRLIILRNGQEYVNKDVSYWTETKNYFKAGIYFSHGKHNENPFKVKIEFNELYVNKINNNQDNNTNNNENNNTFTYGSNSFIFAPYVDTTLYPFPLLSDISNKTNNYNYTLGFIVSNKGKCDASWGGYYGLDKGPDAWINGQHKYLYDEFKKIKEKNGKLIVSFGGQAGTPLFTSCKTSEDLLNQYLKVIDKIGSNYLDFDIEGTALSNKNDIDNLISTLVKLQNKYNNSLHIWFTLPVMPEGLDNSGLYVINKAKKEGLKFDGVNLMTMDYGNSYNKNMGDYAIQAVKNTKKQIGNISIGITPMIGLNDIKSENFTLDNAKKIYNYAKDNGIKRISYWSLNRDHACSKTTTDNKCSSKNNQSKDFEYLKVFQGNIDNNQSNKNDNNQTTQTDTMPASVTLSYPKEKWATKFIDRNKDGKKDLILEVNPWNITKADGTANMNYYAKTGKITYKQDLTNIKQTDAGGWVLGYPEVYVGNKPWNGNYVDGGSKLPTKINNLKSLIVETNYKVNHSANLPIDFAMEGWLTPKKNEKGGVKADGAEFMIMWYHNILGPAGSKIGTTKVKITVNGKEKVETFDIYHAFIGWDFVTFLPKNNYNGVDLKYNIMDFAKVLEEKLPKVKDLYLEDWEFGTEDGSPSTTTAKFDYVINKYNVIGTLKGETTTNTTTNNNLDNNTNQLNEKDKKKIQKYEKKINEYQYKINKYKEKNNSYQEKINSYNQKIEDYKKEIQEYQEKINNETNEKNIKKYNKKIKKLNKYIEKYNKKIQKYQEKISKYNNKIKEYQNKIAEYENKINQIDSKKKIISNEDNDTIENTTNTENTVNINTNYEEQKNNDNNENNTVSNNKDNETLKTADKDNQINDFLQTINDRIINNNSNNEWIDKIKNLDFKKVSIDLGEYNKYYKIFEKFFNDKKQKILDKNLANEDYFNYLNSFNTYTNWVFTDIYNKNYSNIKTYLDGFKKIVNKLKEVK